MALKTSEKTKSEVSETTVLELALYKIYTWQGVSYEQGKPYRFRNSDAMVLLGEQDLGRPVWKLYRPPPMRQAAKPEIVDATTIQAVLPTTIEPGVVSPATSQRIDIGDDSELTDILHPEQNAEGDVTV